MNPECQLYFKILRFERFRKSQQQRAFYYKLPGPSWASSKGNINVPGIFNRRERDASVHEIEADPCVGLPHRLLERKEILSEPLWYSAAKASRLFRRQFTGHKSVSV